MRRSVAGNAIGPAAVAIQTRVQDEPAQSRPKTSRSATLIAVCTQTIPIRPWCRPSPIQAISGSCRTHRLTNGTTAASFVAPAPEREVQHDPGV